MGRDQDALFFKGWSSDPVQNDGIKAGERREQNLSTSRYIVQDISCTDCSLALGWIYIWAANEKYKEREGTSVMYADNFIKQVPVE